MRYFVTVVFGFMALFVSAQEDTVFLSEVAVAADPIYPFVVGGTLRKVDLSEHDLNLADALAKDGGLYFKAYGNQQLATISMRGTSAQQTSVLWHGIPVNYPTLGQMDFSQWPTWLLSSIELQPGSGGALFGSGSIGGTVLLDSDGDLQNQDEIVAARLDIGSYGHSFMGVRANNKLGQLMSQTRVYRTGLRNDFSYIYNGLEYQQENAGVADLGLRQSMQWNHKGHRISLNGMFSINDREIQPVKGGASENELETGNVRLALSHRYGHVAGSFDTSLGFIRNRTLYNREQETVAHQYSVASAYVFELGKQVLGRIGFNGNIYRAEAESYQEDLTDVRTGLFASITAPVTHFWKVTVNARQSIFKDKFPFNPSINQQVDLYRGAKKRLSLAQSVSTGFRIPTLNDLYWSPGGNPDLRPENSINTELGLNWESDLEVIDWGTSLNIFKMWAQDYILWRPGGDGIWSPENIQEVHTHGLEYQNWIHFKSGSLSYKMTGTYSFTRSVNETGDNAGNQLPYIPIHQGGLNLKSTFSSWSLDLNTSYTDRRFTTLDNTLSQSVDGFLLLNVGFERQFYLKDWKLNLGFKVKNLLDNDYENLINLAMPGRNYQLYILIKR
ncbi:MAG: TonB-dependent receptor [Cyclobacteriaceae bacterium]|nr:TonB-dependent receptor [Cyclobacteriaceae bacterium SS2]